MATISFRLIGPLLGGAMACAAPVLAQVPNLPPVCDDAVPSIAELWPPNHKMVDVTVDDVFDPDGDALVVAVTDVFQDEPVDETGDGATCPDAVVDPLGVAVRAERSGSGDGRVYHVVFVADDRRGGVCSGSVQVCVPHDRGRGASCADQGPLFDSTGSAPATCEPLCTVEACVPPSPDVAAICDLPLPPSVERRLERARRLLRRAESAVDVRERRLGRRAARHLRRAGSVLERLGGEACAALVLDAAACAECLPQED